MNQKRSGGQLKNSAKNIDLWAVFLATTCCLILQTPQPITGKEIAPAEVKEWILQQEGDNGKELVCIAPHSIKVVDLDRGGVILTKAPEWKVYYFRPDSKLIWSGKTEEFDIRFALVPPLLRESPDPVKVHAERIREEAGILQTLHSVEKGTFEKLSYESFEYTTRGDRYYLRTTNDISIDPQGAEFLATLAGTVAKGHVPLYLRRLRFAPRSAPVNLKKGYLNKFGQETDTRTGQVEMLVTKSCHVSPYQQKDFQLPVGYKSVKNLSDVAFSNSMKDQLMKSGLEFLEPSDKDK